jgi:SAM-dependent methyltransferase
MSTITAQDPDVNNWERVWDEYPETLFQTVIPQMMEALESLGPEGKLVCEIGCGTGKESMRLSSLGARVVCVDFSEKALRLVQRRAAAISGALTLVKGDTNRLPFRDGVFDVIFHQGLLEHFSDPISVLREQARLVKPGGYLLVDVPQRFHWYALRKRWEMARGTWPYGWETDFSPLRLRRMLRGVGMEPVKTYGWGPYSRAIWMLRHLHEVGQTRFGRPIMPPALAKAYERVWRRWETSTVGCYTRMSVGVVSRKPQ